MVPKWATVHLLKKILDTIQYYSVNNICGNKLSVSYLLPSVAVDVAFSKSVYEKLNVFIVPVTKFISRIIYIYVLLRRNEPLLLKNLKFPDKLQKYGPLLSSNDMNTRNTSLLKYFSFN